MSATKDTLTITDNRTGRQYEVPVKDGTIRAMDLRQIKADEEDFGLMTYDPAFMNTASCKSTITYIDGELPDAKHLEEWTRNITHHTFINENVKKVLDGFHYNAHPMGMFEATVAALSTFYPEAKDIEEPACRQKQIYRLIAKVPTIT